MSRLINIKFLILPLLVFFLYYSNTSMGQVSWDGGGDGISWKDPANWSGDELPESGDSVIIDLNVLVIADSSIHEAGSILIGEFDTLVQDGTIKIDDRVKIDSGGVFIWFDEDWDWKKVDNYGQINVHIETFDRIDSGLVLINHPSGIINIIENPGIRVADGSIINYGEIRLRSPDVGGIALTAGGLGSLKNELGGIIRKTAKDVTHYFDIPLINHGIIQCDSAILEIRNEKEFYSSTQFIVSDSGEIHFVDDLLSFKGDISGLNNGTVLIQCDFESMNGSISFGPMPLIWDKESFVNGDTLINLGKLDITTGSTLFIKDSSVLVNKGEINLTGGSDLAITNGVIINDSLLETSNSNRIQVSGGNLHKIVNTQNGTILKSSGLTSRINVSVYNSGIIKTNVNTLEFGGDSIILEDESELITTDTSTLLFSNSTFVSINGMISGNASGSILLKCDWESNNGSINFSEEGFEWSEFSFVNGGHFTNYGKLKIGDGFKFIKDSSTITNEGVLFTGTNGNLWFEDGTLINDSLILFNGSGDILLNGGALHLIQNNSGGTIRSYGLNIPADLENFGTLELLDGNTTLSGLKKFKGLSQLYVADTATLTLQNSEMMFLGTLYGEIYGQVNLNCDFSSTNGTANLKVNGMRWQSGSFIGGDTLTNIGIITTHTGSSRIFKDSSVLLNKGLIDLISTTSIRIDDGVLLNDSLVQMGSNSSFTWNLGNLHLIYNLENGIFEKTLGVATASIKPDFINDGILRSLQSSLLLQNAFTNSITGRLEGVGTIGLPSSYTNNGTSSPGLSPGKLTINNRLIQDSLGVLEIEINGDTAETQYDQIDAFFAELKGSIDITLGYSPTIGTLYEIVDAGSFGIIECEFPDTVYACYGGAVNAFEVHCLSDKLELEYVGNILDTSGPDLMVQDITIELDSSTGEKTISSNDVDNGTSALCGIDSIVLSRNIFDCSDPDSVFITVTAYSNGNSAQDDSVKVTILKPQFSSIWVNPNASGNGFGLSPENGITDLTTAFSVSNGCVSDLSQIKLTEGIYFPNNMGASNRNSSFILPDSIHLKGGYSSNGMINDPELYPSILSGDIGIESNPSDNVYHVLTISESIDSSILEGLTIKDGRADIAGHLVGGGILVEGKCTMKYVTLTNNYSTGGGGAIFITSPNGHLLMEVGNSTENNSGNSILENEKGSFLYIGPSNHVDK